MFLRAKKERILCPICSTVRERPQMKTPRGKVVGFSILAALFGGASSMLFVEAGPAALLGLVSGVLCFLSFEVYYSLRFRRELECPVCHFDPLLYRRSPDKAKAQCLEELKRKEQLLSQRWQTMRQAPGDSREEHGKRKQNDIRNRTIDLHG